jgi:hypothetical protein
MIRFIDITGGAEGGEMVKSEKVPVEATPGLSVPYRGGFVSNFIRQSGARF